MNRRIVARVIGVLLLVGIGVALGAVFFASDDGPVGREADDRAGALPSGELPVSEEGNELASLVRRGQDLTYHATYEAVGTVPEGAELRIELWRKGGLVRQEQIVEADDRTLHSAGFRLADETILCQREDDEAWTCSPAGAGSSPSATPAPDPLLGQIANELAGKDLEVSDEEVAGRDGRCFVITGEDERAEICITEDGIPLAIQTGEARMELTDLEREVADDVFEPPAG